MSNYKLVRQVSAIKRLLLTNRPEANASPQAEDFVITRLWASKSLAQILTGTVYFKGINPVVWNESIPELDLTSHYDVGTDSFCSTDILRSASFINGAKRPVKSGDEGGGVLILANPQGLNAITDTNHTSMWNNDFTIKSATVVAVMRIRITKTN